MDDFDDSFDATVDSDVFSPEKPKKATKAAPKKASTAKATGEKKAGAPKKAAAPKSDKPKAPAKPRAKKAKVVEEPEPMDIDSTFDMDRSFNVLETPQDSQESPSPPRPSVLHEANAGGVSKKNASETYQKVRPSLPRGSNRSSRNSNTSLFVLIRYARHLIPADCSTLVPPKRKASRCGSTTRRRK
jgi:hypothetical protein